MISPASYPAYTRPLASPQTPTPPAVPPPAVPPAGGAPWPAARSDLSAPAAGLPVLSSAEQQALARQFPEAPALAQRLYGPARPATPPPALGTRLDLRG
ncbi:MAG: hypothetical protein ACK41D_02315 [Rubricoccaceae bacterium]